MLKPLRKKQFVSQPKPQQQKQQHEQQRMPR
jgi:hypothetical protein